MENQEKIIIDTDIGDDIDDAYALTLAVNLRKFDLLGVTTVYRNSFQRAKIASAILEALGEETGVYAGCDDPLEVKYTIEPFEEVLSDGRPVIPHYSPLFAGAPVRDESAVEFLLDTAERYPNEITLVAIGPFTNLARACQSSPSAFRKFKRIFCMGGNLHGKKAEWNIRCDPEAAAIVLASGVPITFIGFDVTSQTYLSEEDETLFLGAEGKVPRMLAAMMQKWMDTHPGRAPTMHDALTVAELVGGFCTYARKQIRIPLEGERRAFTDEADGNAPEVTFAESLDRNAFLRFLKENIFNQESLKEEKI